MIIKFIMSVLLISILDFSASAQTNFGSGQSLTNNSPIPNLINSSFMPTTPTLNDSTLGPAVVPLPEVQPTHASETFSGSSSGYGVGTNSIGSSTFVDDPTSP